MSTNTPVTMESSSRRSRPGAARHPPRVLLKTIADNGIHSNRTSASGLTRNKVPISVSFVFKRPPQPSNLFVCCSDLKRPDSSEIVCSVDDLLLLRVNMGRSGFLSINPNDCDYFIYRANPIRPSLELLQRPHPFFHDHEVGILPRSDGHYTVAALVDVGEHDIFKLHLFHSDTSSWSSSLVSAAEAPQKPFQVKIPKLCHKLFYHDTSTVITIGGERGTMGWVDLWRGILLCDVLDPKPALRGVPLPLPLTKMSYNNGLGVELGYPGHCRGISFIRHKGCLKFVHMEMTSRRLPGYDGETGSLSFRVDDWALTTWTNEKMGDTLDDWQPERSVQAANILIDDDPAISRVLESSGLLPKSRGNVEATARQHGLQNLMMYQPSPCASGEDVVYLEARKKFMHPKAWILAVDMNGEGRLRGLSYLGNQRHRFLASIYCPCNISRHLRPRKFKVPATTPGN